MMCRVALLIPLVLLLGSPNAVADHNAAAAVSLQTVSVEEVAREAERSTLQVNNQTPFIVFIFVEGVRIGWIRPYRTAVIRGLATGSHKLYAHSQYGTMSWGPRDTWIPGNWNLIY